LPCDSPSCCAKDELDLEFREHAVEEIAVENRAGDLTVDFRPDRGVETRDVERDDAAVGL
jgi:hypothetical protein